MMAGEGGAALKGLRLLTLDRGPEGYGFHMYTNKELKVLLTYMYVHCSSLSLMIRCVYILV